MRQTRIEIRRGTPCSQTATRISRRNAGKAASKRRVGANEPRGSRRECEGRSWGIRSAAATGPARTAPPSQTTLKDGCGSLGRRGEWGREGAGPRQELEDGHSKVDLARHGGATALQVLREGRRRRQQPAPVQLRQRHRSQAAVSPRGGGRRRRRSPLVVPCRPWVSTLPCRPWVSTSARARARRVAAPEEAFHCADASALHTRPTELHTMTGRRAHGGWVQERPPTPAA